MLKAALSALASTGLFRPSPWKSALQLVWCAACHGPSLYTVVAWNAWRWPERIAVQDPGETATFRALRQQADQLAARLIGLQSVRSRTPFKVALLHRNHVTFVALLLACSRLGLKTLLLNTTFSPDQLRAICGAEGVSLLLCDDEFAPALEGSGLPVLTVSALSAAPPTRAPLRERWKRSRRKASLLLLTSGTTGRPKTVQHRPRFWPLLQTVTALLERLQLRAGSRTLLTLPLFHGHGLATLGLSLTLASPLHLFPRSGPGEHGRCLSDEQIEVLVLVPTLLYRLLHSPETGLLSDSPLPALRTIVSGSAPLGATLATRARQRFGPVLFNLYGSSETGLISLATPEDLHVAPDSVGHVLPGARVEVQPLPGTCTGPLGRLAVRGPFTAGAALTETDDLGWLGPQGRLFLAGRQGDLLLIGGENVAPEMVEERIAELSYVQECAVSPLPSAEYGQALHAQLVLRPGCGQMDADTIERDLHALLPRRLRPASISVVLALPRNPAGKLLRSQLGQSRAEQREEVEVVIGAKS